MRTFAASWAIRLGRWSRAALPLYLPVCLALCLSGCGEPPAVATAQLRLAAEKPGAADAAPILQLTLGQRFTLGEQEATAQLSRLDLKYTDSQGRAAALVRAAVVYGEPDQTLDEKFAALTDEAKVTVNLKDTYQPVGAPGDFVTADGSAGQWRRYEYQDSNQQKQAHVFAVLDLRKQDAVYVRMQLITPAANWDRLQGDFLALLQSMKRIAP